MRTRVDLVKEAMVPASVGRFLVGVVEGERRGRARMK